MSDLSRLLDDVYGDLGSASATPPATPPSPDADGADDAGWTGGDDAFGSWADDHGARLDGDDAVPTAAVPALSGATGALFLRDLGTGPGEVTGEVPVASPVTAPTWHRADDDILPEGRARAGRRRGRGARTTPPADGSIEDFAAEGSAFDALAALDAPSPATGELPATATDGDGDGTEAAAPAAGRRRGLRRR